MLGDPVLLGLGVPVVLELSDDVGLTEWLEPTLDVPVSVAEDVGELLELGVPERLELEVPELLELGVPVGLELLVSVMLMLAVPEMLELAVPE